METRTNTRSGHLARTRSGVLIAFLIGLAVGLLMDRDVSASRRDPAATYADFLADLDIAE